LRTLNEGGLQLIAVEERKYFFLKKETKTFCYWLRTDLVQ